jgi:hypothetical protein
MQPSATTGTKLTRGEIKFRTFYAGPLFFGEFENLESSAKIICAKIFVSENELDRSAIECCRGFILPGINSYS